ncbi:MULTISPECIES: alkaline phosphatase [unclassified Frankia]|uniref:alkaline phosphatase D family protein n=2 Tax=Frankia TaxID=1854 RepID=UPI001EF4BB1D|nr:MULTISPECIES: alkaline phosphatase D family protein [unclassified Frankia]
MESVDSINPNLARRGFLVASGLSAAGIATASLPAARAGVPRINGYPFTLGVASGEPTSHGIVLWTRLAPSPLEPGGGMPNRSYQVRWILAADDRLTRVIRSGEAPAKPEWSHSVHVEVDGLLPGRDYYYAFEVAGERSAIGHTRTAPGEGRNVSEVTIAHVSCQNYEEGYYAAYREIAQQDLDVVFHVGDYIYEPNPKPGRPRLHACPEPKDLAGYRLRLSQYKTDPDLQAAHAAHPWAVTWDDHEVANDYTSQTNQDNEPQNIFLARRAAAYQAYWEHMPLPNRVRRDYVLYRRLRYGNLAEFVILDTRQYRDAHACNSNGVNSGQIVSCTENQDPARSILGAPQRDWLLKGFTNAGARWNVLVQQILMAQLDLAPGPLHFWSEFWDSYAAERRTVLQAMHDRKVSNPVVLTGDIHAFLVNDLHTDFRDPDSPVVGTELVGTAISSVLPAPFPTIIRNALPLNPHIKQFQSDYRGYILSTINRDVWTAELRAVRDFTKQDSDVFQYSTWAIENGRPGAVQA